MLVAKPQINPLAESALRQISAAGVDVTPNVVLWVHDAAERIRGCPHRTPEEIADWPIACGGALLYPLTFGAYRWLRRLPDSVADTCRAVAYACAHSRRPSVLQALCGACAAVLAVNDWADKLTCSPAALEATVDQLFLGPQFVEIDPHGKRPATTRNTADFGVVVRALCSRYAGTTPDYWLWQVSREECHRMMQDANNELPTGQQVTAHEFKATADFWAVVAHIIAEGKTNGR